jgi:hypothetical protein
MKKAKRYRVKVRATRESTECLVDCIVESTQKPKTIVKNYLMAYPGVHHVEAMEENPFITYRYSISSNPN